LQSNHDLHQILEKKLKNVTRGLKSAIAEYLRSDNNSFATTFPVVVNKFVSLSLPLYKKGLRR